MDAIAKTIDVEQIQGLKLAFGNAPRWKSL